MLAACLRLGSGASSKAFVVVSGLALLLVLCPFVLANDSVALLFSHPNYDYAPSMIDEGNVQKFWWCGSGTTVGYSGGTDVIYYRSYTDSTQQWSLIYQVLSPTVGSWEFNGGAGTCNPTVIKGSFSPGNGHTYTYALYYTAQNDNFGKIGVAFSNDGVNFVKYASNPIVYPIVFPPPLNRYGAASLSTWNSNGGSAVYLFEYDDSSSYGGRGWWRFAGDGIHFGSATVISNSATFGTPSTPTSNAPMNDVAYDASTATFYGVTESQFRPGDREGWMFGFYRMAATQVFSGGSGTWELLGLVDTNLTNSYLNLQAKILRNGYGNTTSFLPNLEAFFSTGTNDVTTWDLHYIEQFAQPSTIAFKRYYNPNGVPISHHWVTTGAVDSGYNLKRRWGISLWYQALTLHRSTAVSQVMITSYHGIRTASPGLC